MYQPNDAGEEWEATGSTEVLEASSLTAIESFPAIDAVDSDDGEGSNESAIKSASGGETGSQQQTADTETETPIQNMETSKYDIGIDTLAANTAFSWEELSNMDETGLRVIAKAANINLMTHSTRLWC